MFSTTLRHAALRPRSGLRRASSLAVGAAMVAGVALVSAAPAAAEGEWIDRTLQDSRIVESSGLARSGRNSGVLWTHNDSGDGPRVFAVDDDGRTLGTYNLDGAYARDWEAMARSRDGSGTPILWVGDIGDNARARSEIQVYRFVEPSGFSGGTVDPTTYRFRYEDGAHDAEALMIEPSSGRLYIATKSSGGGGIYVAPSTLSTSSVNTLRRVGNAPSTITDGVFMADGRLVLRNYTTLFVSAGIGDVFVPLSLPSQPQGETVTHASGYGGVLIGSEGSYSKVWWVPVDRDLV